jgi:magnesium chelatase family protein
MDLLVNVERPAEHELRGPSLTTSARARERVGAARERQERRLAGTGASCNGEMGSRLVRRHARLDPAAELALGAAYEQGALSARGRHRVVRVARTLADLDGRERVSAGDVLMAVSLRQRDRAEGMLAA